MNARTCPVAVTKTGAGLQLRCSAFSLPSPLGGRTGGDKETPPHAAAPRATVKAADLPSLPEEPHSQQSVWRTTRKRGLALRATKAVSSGERPGDFPSTS